MVKVNIFLQNVENKKLFRVFSTYIGVEAWIDCLIYI